VLEGHVLPGCIPCARPVQEARSKLRQRTAPISSGRPGPRRAGRSDRSRRCRREPRGR
jgi:hypothetical protein